MTIITRRSLIMTRDGGVEATHPKASLSGDASRRTATVTSARGPVPVEAYAQPGLQNTHWNR